MNGMNGMAALATRLAHPATREEAFHFHRERFRAQRNARTLP